MAKSEAQETETRSKSVSGLIATANIAHYSIEVNSVQTYVYLIAFEWVASFERSLGHDFEWVIRITVVGGEPRWQPEFVLDHIHRFAPDTAGQRNKLAFGHRVGSSWSSKSRSGKAVPVSRSAQKP